MAAPTVTPLDAERARLRARGHNEAEISQILILQEVATSQRQQASGGGAAPGNMTGILGNAAAVASHARGMIPFIKGELANVFSRRASPSSRARSTGLLALAVVVVAALGFYLYQEAKQLMNANKLSDLQISAQTGYTASVSDVLDGSIHPVKPFFVPTPDK